MTVQGENVKGRAGRVELWIAELRAELKAPDGLNLRSVARGARLSVHTVGKVLRGAKANASSVEVLRSYYARLQEQRIDGLPKLRQDAERRLLACRASEAEEQQAREAAAAARAARRASRRGGAVEAGRAGGV